MNVQETAMALSNFHLSETIDSTATSPQFSQSKITALLEKHLPPAFIQHVPHDFASMTHLISDRGLQIIKNDQLPLEIAKEIKDSVLLCALFSEENLALIQKGLVTPELIRAAKGTHFLMHPILLEMQQSGKASNIPLEALETISPNTPSYKNLYLVTSELGREAINERQIDVKTALTQPVETTLRCIFDKRYQHLFFSQLMDYLEKFTSLCHEVLCHQFLNEFSSADSLKAKLQAFKPQQNALSV